MDGSERRRRIQDILEAEREPVSATILAKEFGVSRQVIVQDIALLRANNRNILSTNKGYILYKTSEDKTCKRIIPVKHTDEQMRDELYAIVDAGAKVLDVIIEHDVYGQISADLAITSRRDVDEFIRKIFTNKAKPLKELTHDAHFHTIEASDEEVLDDVERSLAVLGLLLSIE